jgi:hypothetical protein
MNDTCWTLHEAVVEVKELVPFRYIGVEVEVAGVAPEVAVVIYTPLHTHLVFAAVLLTKQMT